MHRALLGLAAIAAFTTISPAQGQNVLAAGFSASAAHEGFTSSDRGFRVRFGSGNFRNCGGQHCRHVHLGDGFAYSGYNDYGDYDANRSFDPDRWNDWWHERPERAFPRWMSRNRDCALPWYSADVLTC